MSVSSIFDNIVIHNPKAIEAYIQAMEQRENGTFPEEEIPDYISIATQEDIERLYGSNYKRQ
ncbi:MAG: hypothetical protein IJ876_06095 [Elusimicrobiaceae bacterium]|nr:hypothetical protein [Elusimicrobiaceae bacterium]